MIDNKIMKTYIRPDVLFERGEGVYMYDTDGNAYLDFYSGVAVNALGHNHPAVVEAIQEQGQKLMHVSNLYWSQPQIDLANYLIEKSDHDEVFFVNSGTEAVETAIKLARKHGKKISPTKTEILYLENSFHGRTVGALSLTGQSKYQVDFMPLMDHAHMVKVNDIEDLKKKFKETTCAIFIEPIQGEGGIKPVDSKFIQAARELCNNNDALLIFDEVQCGISRIGSFYAHEKIGVTPDIFCLAKGLGGGFPIGAVIANKKANVFDPGDHGCTYGGNPLACAVSLAVVQEVGKEDFMNEVSEKGAYIRKKLTDAIGELPIFKSIEGMGLMLGLHLNGDAKAITKKAFDEKLILITAGQSVIRLIPALNISYENIDKALDTLIDIIKEQ